MNTLADNSESKKDLRQTTFLDGADLNGVATAREKKSRGSSSLLAKELLQASLSEVLRPLAIQLNRIEQSLEALAKGSVQQVVKEYYSTTEAAKLLGKRPYTVREWCRLGRVNAEKAEFGRGLDEEWRISHEEIERIRNQGLLTMKVESQIGGPDRIMNRHAG